MMTELSNKVTVLKYTAMLCNALVDHYLRHSIRLREQTLKSRPDSKSTKEQLQMLKMGITKVTFIFETGRKYHKILEIDSRVDRSTHAFVDKETGDVFKPASYKSPAKGVRLSLIHI